MARGGRAYRRIGAALSTVTIVVGLAMIGATFAAVGPALRVGVVLGALLMVYGAARLYLILRR